MFHLVYTNQFKKDVKKISRRGYDMQILKHIIVELEKQGTLDKFYKPHKLTGKYSDFWEAHIKSDWLLIWKILKNEKEIWLVRTGTHSDLF